MIGGTAQPIVIQTAPIQARERHLSSQIITVLVAFYQVTRAIFIVFKIFCFP